MLQGVGFRVPCPGPFAPKGFASRSGDTAAQGCPWGVRRCFTLGIALVVTSVRAGRGSREARGQRRGRSWPSRPAPGGGGRASVPGTRRGTAGFGQLRSPPGLVDGRAGQHVRREPRVANGEHCVASRAGRATCSPAPSPASSARQRKPVPRAGTLPFLST